MDAQTLVCSLFLLSLSLSLTLLLRKTKPRLNLPPSPTNSLPVIGHLRLLKPPIHRKFLSISESLGGAPIFYLRLGNRLVYIVSSLSIAEECFTKNDVVLANRPQLILNKHVGYNFTTMIGASYGEHWRNLRLISTVELLSSHRLNNFLSIRKDEIRRLIIHLSHNSLHGFAKVEMRSMLVDLTFNNIMRMLAGKRYYADHLEDTAETKRVRQLVADVVRNAGAGNAADYCPFIRWFSNLEKRIKKLAGRVDTFLQELIDEKRAEKNRGSTMIDHLISLQESQPQYYTDTIIKGLILVLIIGGTDTSATTLEWSLSNLLNHPEILRKARTEIDNKIGLDRLINEPDISNLPYLQNIISETFRLYPVLPLLFPHMASENCKVAGYDMPRGAILLINAWAIHRDPKIWKEPTSFKPERFGSKGEDKKLMPFGLGRRTCPGSGLAQRLVALALGSLIQCFEWERLDEQEVDMAEGTGATMPKATPLLAMCKTRAIVLKILNKSDLK